MGVSLKPLLCRRLLGILFVLCLPELLFQLGAFPEGVTLLARLLFLALLIPLLWTKLAFRATSLLVIAASWLFLYQPLAVRTLVQGLDHRVRDAFFLFRGPLSPSKDIVIVDIDQKSLEKVGQWPWPRTEVASALKSILADGAKVVGFDVVFAEEDRLSVKDWVQRLRILGAKVELPEDETGAVHFSAQAVEALVLDDWKYFFSSRDPLFQPADKQDLIQYYLEYEKKRWDEQQEVCAARANNAGLTYQRQAYEAPENPLMRMAEYSRELFILTGPEGRGSLLQTGAELVFDNDQALADACAAGTVVAGGLFITGSRAGSRVGALRRHEALDETRGMVVNAPIEGAREVFPGLRHAVQQVINVEAVQNSVHYQGMFNIAPDHSGAARHYTMLMEAPVFQRTLVLKEGLEGMEGAELLKLDNYETRVISQDYTYPSLALEMYRAAKRYKRVIPRMKKGRRSLYLSTDCESEKCRIPVDHRSEIPIQFLGYGGAWQPEHYYGPEYFMSYVSLVDVLFHRFPKGTFKDKYVLIGSTSPTLSDHVGSPFSPAFPGLEVHATVLDNLIEQRILRDLGDEGRLWTFLVVFIGGLALSVIVSYSQAWVSALFTFLVLMGLPAMSYAAFSQAQLVVDFVFPWLTAALITATGVLLNFFVEGRDRRFVVAQFGKMVSPQVLARLRDEADGLLLLGQRCEVTVLFADLEGFTTMAEAMEAQQLVTVINEYLTPISEVIMEEEGFIDKYIGDAVMAVWGVPHKTVDHAYRACSSALKQQEKVRQLRPLFAEKYGVELRCRVGVASGEVCAALMGSEDRKSYTVVGDAVNLSARLEPASKDYGVAILIAESTYKLVEDRYVGRCLDKLLVKGKSVAVTVYELVDKRESCCEERLATIALFEKALEAHWRREWEESLLKLEAYLQREPDDQAARNLRARVLLYSQSPPPPEWQGEYIRSSKD